MVKVRLARGGSKKKPFYRIVVADARMPVKGRFIERIGFFNPIARGQEERIRIDLAKLEEWIGKGAIASDRVVKLSKEYQKSIANA